jgi:PleD family two-component response regulator
MEKKEKILIVEDHPATARLISHTLESDYDILSANNGKEALEIVDREKEISLILLDVIMPVMNGYEVCQKLKENPLTENIPIIFLTMLESEEDEARGFDLGVNDYIIKPIMPIRLKTRIKNQLDLNRKSELLVKKNIELQKAVEHINTLHGILPICSYCKQIRNDGGAWQQIEEYVRANSEAEFSHGICPDCLKKNFPDFT